MRASCSLTLQGVMKLHRASLGWGGWSGPGTDSLTQNCAQRGGDRGGTSPMCWGRRKGAETITAAHRCAVTPPLLQLSQLKVAASFFGGREHLRNQLMLSPK